MTLLSPTPVRWLERLSTARTALWLKDDGVTSTIYGGNKVRKIGRLLEHARELGADTVVTVGAAGSHHVLTTGLFGRPLGLRVEAVVVAQPYSAHAQETLLAGVSAGIELIPASSAAHAALLVASRVLRGASFIPAGGSTPLGAGAFVDAALELAAQVRQGELPSPDLVVVPMGSGGTAAGLAAGFAYAGLATRVLAVTVAEPAWLVEQRVRSLAEACTRPAHRASALQLFFSINLLILNLLIEFCFLLLVTFPMPFLFHS